MNNSPAGNGRIAYHIRRLWRVRRSSRQALQSFHGMLLFADSHCLQPPYILSCMPYNSVRGAGRCSFLSFPQFELSQILRQLKIPSRSLRLRKSGPFWNIAIVFTNNRYPGKSTDLPGYPGFRTDGLRREVQIYVNSLILCRDNYLW